MSLTVTVSSDVTNIVIGVLIISFVHYFITEMKVYVISDLYWLSSTDHSAILYRKSMTFGIQEA